MGLREFYSDEYLSRDDFSKRKVGSVCFEVMTVISNAEEVVFRMVRDFAEEGGYRRVIWDYYLGRGVGFDTSSYCLIKAFLF